MFGFAHNGHGALSDERDRHRAGAQRRGARRERLAIIEIESL